MSFPKLGLCIVHHNIAPVLKFVYVVVRDKPQACESVGLLVHIWGKVA
jgi:hypothetical protein